MTRESPEVLMPSTRPSTSTSGPPEKPGYSATSRRTSWSTVAGAPGSPRAAETADDAETGTHAALAGAPQGNDDVAGFQTGAIAEFGRALHSAASTFSTARSVPASLPASVAATLRPSGSVMVISSSRFSACSAVTTTPGPPARHRSMACAGGHGRQPLRARPAPRLRQDHSIKQIAYS